MSNHLIYQPNSQEDEAMRKMGIGFHEGYAGAFTTSQAEGAYPNGSVVEKIVADSGDTTPLGTRGKVLGSLGHPEGFGYFVEWDDRPKMAIFVAGKKIGRVKESHRD